MNRFKKISKVKICIAIMVLIAIGFGIYNLMWFRYIKEAFDPFLNSEGMQTKLEENYEYEHTDLGWDIHRYRDNGYTYTIGLPPYLSFGGYVQILTQTEVNLADEYVSECILDIMIYPNNWHYGIGIADLTTVNKRGENVRSIGMAVDRNGTPKERPPDDSEAELYQEWLALYEKYNDAIMKQFEVAKEFFGEDAFRE